jgi:hypothetical protein
MQTSGKGLGAAMLQHLTQQEIEETDLSEQVPSSSNSVKLNVAAVMQHIIAHLRDMSQEDKVVVITTLMEYKDWKSV